MADLTTDEERFYANYANYHEFPGAPITESAAARAEVSVQTSDRRDALS